MSYLGIDIGTSSIKGMVVNEKGNVLTFNKFLHDYVSKHEGWIELDPDLIFNNVKKIINKLSGEVKSIDPIKVISFSCLGTAFVPIDRNGIPLYNAISALDVRSRNKLNYFDKKGIDNYEIYQITGQPGKVISLLHNIIWLKENHPDKFIKIYKFVSMKDYCIFKLSGELITDFTQASRTMLYDFRCRNWSELIFSLLEIDMETFPKIISSYEIISDSLNKKICEELNLNHDVKLTAGAHDTECCILGANINSYEDMGITVGTYEEPMFVCNEFNPSLSNYKNNIIIEEHILKNKYINYSVFYTGLILEWIRKIFFSDIDNKVIYGFDDITCRLDNNANEIVTVPYLKGTGAPKFDDNQKAVIFNITNDTNKYDIVKSFIESTDFCLKRIIKSFGHHKMRNIFVIGGGSKSDFLMQSKANILNSSLKILNIEECGAYGATMVACYADNKFANFKELFKTFKNSVCKIYEPQIEFKRQYTNKYKFFERFLEQFYS